jgi:hypothetical protein
VSQSTGPVLIAGGLTLFTDVIVGGRTIAEDVKVIVGTGIVAVSLAGLESIAPRTAVALAYLMLVSVLFVQHGNTPSPVQAFVTWYGKG